MGHNSVVSGHPKSTGIPRVVNRNPGFGASHVASYPLVDSLGGEVYLLFSYLFGGFP